MKPAPPEQLSFFLDPVLERTGPDTFRVKSWKQIKHLTVRICAERAGVSDDTIRRLIDTGFLKAERPTPRKTLVDAESFEQYLRARKDPEFWTEERRARFLAWQQKPDQNSI